MSSGSMASVVAISSARLRPYGRFTVVSSAKSSRSTSASSSRARSFSSLSTLSLRQKWKERPVLRCRPMRTFSSTVNWGKTAEIWKERMMPRRAMSAGASPVISSPLKKICPEVGVRNLVSRLKQVVFPAPLGPMRAWMVPRRTFRFTSFTATKPRNSFTRRLVSSMWSVIYCLTDASWLHIGFQKYERPLTSPPCGFYIGRRKTRKGKLPACRRCWSLVLVFAQVRNAALRALGFACHAYLAAVKDQPVVGILAERLRNQPLEPLLDLQHILARRDARAIRDTENVRVYRHGGMAESGVQHDIGGLAPHAGQGFERFARLRHFAAVLFEQNAAGRDDVAGLCPVQADGLDVFRDAFLAQCQQAFRRAVLGKELACGQIHGAVRRLCGKQHGDQQLKGCVVFQFRCRVRVGRLQALKNLSAFGCVHGVCRRARALASTSAISFFLSGASAGSAATGALLAKVRAAGPDGSSCSLSSRRRRCSWRLRAASASARVHSRPAGIISMQSTGQGGTQSSQPVHKSGTTVCIWRFAPTMASTGQACIHKVQPMQCVSSISATYSWSGVLPQDASSGTTS